MEHKGPRQEDRLAKMFRTSLLHRPEDACREVSAGKNLCRVQPDGKKEMIKKYSEEKNP